MEKDPTLTLELVRFFFFIYANRRGFKVSRLMGSVCVCVRWGREGSGACGLQWQPFLNQVWHSHMKENNGILYVFEHVSVSKQLQMESDCYPRLRRMTTMLKWESGNHEANHAADLTSDRPGTHCHTTSSRLKISILSFLSLFTCLLTGVRHRRYICILMGFTVDRANQLLHFRFSIQVL